MGTLVAWLPRIGARRVVLSAAMAVGGVLVAGSLAWACTALVHSVSFEITPPTSTCQAMQDLNGDNGNEKTPSYDCTEVVASVTGHADLDCANKAVDPLDTTACTVQQDIRQEMKAWKPVNLPSTQSCGPNSRKVGEITLTGVHDVDVEGDPQNVNGGWFTGAGTVEPNVNPDGQGTDKHPQDSVRYYQMCTPPSWAKKTIAIAKIGQKP